VDGTGASLLRAERGTYPQGMGPSERKKNYDCDITYVTNSEVGFDYLRDNMATSMVDVVQRPFNYCVIDEVDSILVTRRELR